jgi:hypothetical protein
MVWTNPPLRLRELISVSLIHRRPVIFAFPSNFSNISPKAILRNQLEMVENEDGSEGGSSGLFAAGTSNPDPADTSVGGV